MADLETGIRNALLADTGIAGIVADRVRPLGMAPDDNPPYLTYEITDDQTDHTLADGPCDYVKAEFEIGVFAATYDGVMTLSKLVKKKLDGFGETIDGVEFAPAMYVGQTDIEEDTPEGQEKPVYLRVQTFKCLYKLTA